MRRELSLITGVGRFIFSHPLSSRNEAPTTDREQFQGAVGDPA